MTAPVSVPHMRYLRHRKLEGLVRGAEGAVQDVPRLRDLGAFTSARSTALTGTGAAQVFTAAASDIVTIAGHGRLIGDGPFTVFSATTLPAGLSIDTQYWVNVIDVNTFTFHLTQDEAFLGINPVDITDAGTGIHTMIPDDREEGIVSVIRQGETTDNIQAATDIDDLI